jgi:FkbM family methyltransferase
MIKSLIATTDQQLARPDDWLYDRAVLAWILDPSLRRQLPFLYRVFGWYSNLYFKFTGYQYLAGGRQLFRFLSTTFQKLSPEQYLELNIAGYRVFLNPIDMRLFQVVNEIASPNADTKILTQLLSDGDTFLDVGANHGSFAIVASKLVGVNGFVLAVEPQPRLAKAVEKSLTANAVGKFQIHNLAVGNTDGEIELLVPIGTSGSAGIFPEHSAIDRHQVIKVPLRRFDDLVDWQKFTGKVVLKLDVEGSECAFLLGASQMIRALKPKLIIEVHPNSLKAAGATGDELKQLLQSLGYTHYVELDSEDKRTFCLEDLNTNLQRNVLMSMA